MPDYIIRQRDRGQTEAKCLRPRPRPRLRGQGRGQNFGLEATLASKSKCWPRGGLSITGCYRPADCAHLGSSVCTTTGDLRKCHVSIPICNHFELDKIRTKDPLSKLCKLPSCFHHLLPPLAILPLLLA